MCAMAEEESSSTFERVHKILLTIILPSANLHLHKHWALALVTWFLVVTSLMFAMLFYYFYNDCQLQFVDVDAKSFDVGLFTDPYSGNYLCGTYKSNLIPCMMPGLSCSDYGKSHESMCTGGVHCGDMLSCECSSPFIDDCSIAQNLSTIIPGFNSTFYITDPNTQMVYLVCPPLYLVIINALQYTLFAKLLVIATFVSFYLMRHKIEHDGIWSTLFSANAWLDTLMDAVDQSLPSLQNQSVGGVSALRGVVKRSSIVQSRLSKVVPANESNPSLPAEQPASPEQRQQSIPEEGSSKSSHESAWGGGAFANRVLRSLFPHITITIPSGLWAWSFILWMLASFCTIFIVLLEYFLFYDCTSAQTIVNAAFTDYKPDIYSEVFNTNNRHVCSSRIYGSSADIQDKAPYDCVLPGLTCSDYDTAYARGTCSSHHCNDTLPCISHVFEGKLDMDSPYTCSLSSCLINVEYASCHASYEAVMIALQYTLLAKALMACVYFAVFFLHHNGVFFLCEKATWLSFWACLNPIEADEEDAEEGEPAGSPQAKEFELVPISPLPAVSEPASSMQKPKQKHASSNAWSVVMQVTRRFVDYLSQVFLAMVIPLSRHQFHGWISFAFMFWFVLASGAVFGSLMWYFLIDCQVTSSIMDFIEASGMLQGSSTNICKSSAYIGLLDPCAYSEHHICGAVVKKRHETDCTEFSTDYVGYNNGTNICGYLTSSAVFKCAFSFDNETCGPDSIDYVASYMPFWMSDDDASVFNFEAGYVIPCVLEGMTCDDYANFHPDKYCGTKTCKNNRFCSASIGATYTGSLGSVEHYSCNTVSVAFVVAMQYTLLVQVLIVLLYFVQLRIAQYGITAIMKKEFWRNLLEM